MIPISAVIFLSILSCLLLVSIVMFIKFVYEQIMTAKYCDLCTKKRQLIFEKAAQYCRNCKYYKYSLQYWMDKQEQKELKKVYSDKFVLK